VIRDNPGITVEQLQAALGVSRSRVWQILGHLQAGRVRYGGRA
jgi:biotin operon repressor